MHITFLLYDGMTALDLVGPYEILSRLPNAQVNRVALNPGPISTDSNLMIVADSKMSELSKTDVLIVPGAGSATTLQEYPMILEWINKIHSTTTWTTSVCTGSLILGASGILDGVKATTHWAAFERLSMWGAIPTPMRIVQDGKIVTAAGVSAGIDMALVLSSKIVGSDFAKAMQLALEYDPNPPFDVGSPGKAPKALVDSLRLKMTSRFEKIQE